MTNENCCAILSKHSRVPPQYRGVEQLEARRAHNPEVVGSSPASATITDTVMDTNVSVTVSFFISIFTPKRGKTPNIATHLCLGFQDVVICPRVWIVQVLHIVLLIR